MEAVVRFADGDWSMLVSVYYHLVASDGDSHAVRSKDIPKFCYERSHATVNIFRRRRVKNQVSIQFVEVLGTAINVMEVCIGLWESVGGSSSDRVAGLCLKNGIKIMVGWFVWFLSPAGWGFRSLFLFWH
jgi:hypothetical protein